ncbi:hypothetical protein CYMTET_27706 [Cymbomonas tetramitiformis]|uniref:AB hydrolase-1 domain-containing protein n=1 Tax=Cymbomonas tetramitiformis TaxID=36881 RepID=A0AAE0FPB0_9CHLO|nr:hypothetical protein CYMTET_27706 [Cymbomonas tetramitiformis]
MVYCVMHNDYANRIAQYITRRSVEERIKRWYPVMNALSRSLVLPKQHQIHGRNYSVDSPACCKPLTVASGSIACEIDSNGIERLSLREDGWSYYKWRGHACHYISAGEDNEGPLVVLVHGFGAHAYHWRYTIPALAKDGFRVYALCMMGVKHLTRGNPKAVRPSHTPHQRKDIAVERTL